MAPALNYYNNILSGNPQAISAAVGPQASNLAAIESGALNQATQGMPQGGYRASTMAGLPQQQAQQVGNAVLALQPQAAAALQAAGPQISGIGSQQAAIGQGVAGTGMSISQLGQQLASMGIQVSETQLADILQKMGINYQAPNWQQSLGAVTGAIGDLVGAGVGAYGASKGKFPITCWIAEAIYGADDFRTHLLRAYLNGPFRETAFGRFVMSLYLRFGRRIAWQVRRHGWLKRAFKSLFDKALGKAVAWTLTFSAK